MQNSFKKISLLFFLILIILFILPFVGLLDIYGAGGMPGPTGRTKHTCKGLEFPITFDKAMDASNKYLCIGIHKSEFIRR